MKRRARVTNFLPWPMDMEAGCGILLVLSADNDTIRADTLRDSHPLAPLGIALR